MKKNTLKLISLLGVFATSVYAQDANIAKYGETEAQMKLRAMNAAMQENKESDLEKKLKDAVREEPVIQKKQKIEKPVLMLEGVSILGIEGPKGKLRAEIKEGDSIFWVKEGDRTKTGAQIIEISSNSVKFQKSGKTESLEISPNVANLVYANKGRNGPIGENTVGVTVAPTANSLPNQSVNVQSLPPLPSSR